MNAKKTITVLLSILVAWIMVPTIPASAGVLETLEVSSRTSRRSEPVYSETVLEEGRTYLIEASGTYVFVGSRMADAEFSYYSTPDTWIEELGGSYEEHILDLVVNDTPRDWLGSEDGETYSEHTFSPDHIYRLYVVGEGEPLSFYTYDTNNGGNVGSLTVTISEVLPMEKGDCQKGGWMEYHDMFKNQGMCIRSLK